MSKNNKVKKTPLSPERTKQGIKITRPNVILTCINPTKGTTLFLNT